MARLLGDRGGEVNVDLTPRDASEVARPGWLTLPLEGRTVEIRFPEYAAGHTVPATAATELADDVRAWIDRNRRAPLN